MWIMILIMLTVDGVYTEHVGTYSMMDMCFAEREILVEQLGRPPRNYQVVCIENTRPYE